MGNHVRRARVVGGQELEFTSRNKVSRWQALATLVGEQEWSSPEVQSAELAMGSGSLENAKLYRSTFLEVSKMECVFKSAEKAMPLIQAQL